MAEPRLKPFGFLLVFFQFFLPRYLPLYSNCFNPFGFNSLDRIRVEIHPKTSYEVPQRASGRWMERPW